MTGEEKEPKPGRPLYVVADDAAVDARRDEGILRCLDAGLVRNVSVLAHGPHLEDFAGALGERPGVGIALHLNLTWDRPLSSATASLTDNEGAFLETKQSFWSRCCTDGVDPADVHAEAKAQLERLREAGLEPTGVNGHNHVHVLPGVREGVARLMADDPGLRWWRTLRPAPPPLDAAPVAGPPLPAPITNTDSDADALDTLGEPVLAAFAAHSAAAKAVLGTGIAAAGRFAGLRFSESPDLDTLLSELAACGTSTVELMVHPGDCAGDSVPYSGLEGRERECRLLSDGATLAAVEAEGWRPASFADA
ncbi:MAG: carbohydrate deacetylase [Planctomycetota bacterium]|jgi:predicted glycoside hydrolase/deacetylase ChbG (UPF0249 family)